MIIESRIQILVNAKLSRLQAAALLNVAEAFVASAFADDVGEAGDQLYEADFINQVEHEALRELDDRLKQ
jgi:hypothetical protein